MRHVIFILSTVFFVCVLLLASTSDIDELALIEQAKQEQRDHIRAMAARHEAYRTFYRIKLADLN